MAGKPKKEGPPYRLGGMGYQDASGRRLSYDSYLHLPQLLELQQGLTQAHDELLFIVVHQVYELWFKVLIHELESGRSAIEGDGLGVFSGGPVSGDRIHLGAEGRRIHQSARRRRGGAGPAAASTRRTVA